MTGFMGFPFVKGYRIGGWCRDCTHAARRLTRFSGPGHYCSANHPKWSGWQELHLRPPPPEGGRLLLTLHPEKLAARVGLAPTPCGLTNRRATLTPPGNLQLALPAGFAPASVRLEDECLVDFGHGSIWKWSARQELHLRSLGPKPSALAATLRAVGPACSQRQGRRNAGPNPDNGPAVRSEIGGPEGSCT